jgi:hypothetical protein
LLADFLTAFLVAFLDPFLVPFLATFFVALFAAFLAVFLAAFLVFLATARFAPARAALRVFFALLLPTVFFAAFATRIPLQIE